MYVKFDKVNYVDKKNNYKFYQQLALINKVGTLFHLHRLFFIFQNVKRKSQIVRQNF